MHWPKPIGSPVLESLNYAIESSHDVHTHYDKIVEVASWMAYEELPMPEFALPFGVGQGDANEAIDFVMVADSIDTAFTNFDTHAKFQMDYAGRHWSDSDAEFACLKRAMDGGRSPRFALHLDHLGDAAENIRSPPARPIIGQLAHRRGRRDRVDRDHFTRKMGDRGRRLIPIDGD